MKKEEIFKHKITTDLIITLLSFAIFLFIGIIASGDETNIGLDQYFLKYLPQSPANNLKVISSIVSFSGSVYWFLSVSGILSLLLFYKGLKTYAFDVPIVFIVSLTAQEIFKIAFNRARPVVSFETTFNGLSFPSGHAAVSTAVYGVLIYYILSNWKNKALSISVSTFLVALIVSISISRVILGAHYPTDVIGGMSLGLGILFLFLVVKKLVVSKLKTTPS